jgi:hypothetical protein
MVVGIRSLYPISMGRLKMLSTIGTNRILMCSAHATCFCRRTRATGVSALAADPIGLRCSDGLATNPCPGESLLPNLLPNARGRVGGIGVRGGIGWLKRSTGKAFCGRLGERGVFVPESADRCRFGMGSPCSRNLMSCWASW